MAYCWLKRRGKTWWLFYAQSVGLKPESLHTSDKSLAAEVQRRRDSEVFCGMHGIQRASIEKLRYSAALKKYQEHKNATAIDEKTLSNYSKLLNHFGRFLKGDIYVQQITLQMVEAFISSRRMTKAQWGEGHLAPKTIRNEVFVLVNFFGWLTDNNYVATNPIARLKKPKRVVYDAPRYLTYDEYLKLKSEISDARFADYVDLYLLTGIRRADGLKLTSENFDFERMVAILPQHKQGNTKQIPISPDLEKVVRRLIERVGEGNPFVQIHESRLTTNFAKARDDAGLPKSITFHSLRHSFASWLAAAGVDFRTLQTLIGHKNSESTQIYVHAFNPNMRTAIEKLVLPREKVKEAKAG